MCVDCDWGRDMSTQNTSVYNHYISHVVYMAFKSNRLLLFEKSVVPNDFSSSLIFSGIAGFPTPVNAGDKGTWYQVISYHMISVTDQIALFKQTTLPKSQTSKNLSWQTAKPFQKMPKKLHVFIDTTRSIHSPRDLYIDPPNINMEIGWHLSFLPSMPMGTVELHGGTSVGVETDGVRERE